MKKRYKKTNSGYMRRTSRIYVRKANKGKIIQLKAFLILYQQMINYLIVRFWSSKDFSPNLADKEFTQSIQKKFNITARLAQCVSKQAKEIVRSQIKRHKKTLPKFKEHIANIDSRFIKIEQFDGHFQIALKFASGIPKVIIPINWTKHTNKFLNDNWELSKSIRLGYNKKGLFVDLIFEKERPPLKTEGILIGIDSGLNTMLVTSNGQYVGSNLKQEIQRGLNRKTWHYYIQTETDRYIKELKLEDIKTISLENLKNVKKNMRGKFPRKLNRLLSFWLYSRIIRQLKYRCEEKGIALEFKNPWKTSQRCTVCGNIDKRNRKSDKFLCLECGYETNADYNASKNLELLGLAEVYSLSLLKNIDMVKI